MKSEPPRVAAPRRPRCAIWREPLLAFVVLGLVVFGLDRAFAPDEAAPARRVVLDAETRAGLVDELEAALGRAPTSAEIADAERRWVSAEILFREGLALGLERDDPVVRQRIAEKMQLSLDDLAAPAPEPGELEAYFEANAARYGQPATVDFVHVWLDEGGDPQAALGALKAGADPLSLGRAFPSGRRFRRRTQARVAADFGQAFAAELFASPNTGRWLLRRSDHGEHLVKTLASRPTIEPELDEVRERALEHWRQTRRVEHVRARVDELERGWEVVIER